MDTCPENLTARVFFALWPTDDERIALADWQPALVRLCGGRVMRAETLHLTLVFLGEIPCNRLEALCLAAQQVSGQCFGLSLDVARYWGHNHILYTAPRVVPPQLAQLVRELEKQLRRQHFKFDAREYKPHVTLLRNAHWRDDPLPELPPVRLEVGSFVLLQSVQQDGAAAYRILARFPLSESVCDP
ncbi:MAG: RNA 2',3'-cyclic phosphodiesterase [Gallionella sp.]|nr:RNA 2',3'-cyclic phosphodiesterase [Gallionella sp.]MDD4947105.1 RNA 2',3'-cyclic phosphodiesterase [Gallionella sp.]MDD5611648.1 RNA 2',3'-cyclic phosphodiesterase [Gallionella sp.]